MRPIKQNETYDIDANKVIDSLLEDIKQLHRDKAILKSQYEAEREQRMAVEQQLLQEVRKDVKDDTQ